MKKTKDKQPAFKRPIYKRFITDRDRALERLHMRSQERITDALSIALSRIYDMISTRIMHASNTLQGIQSAYILKQIQNRIEHEFSDATAKIVEAFMKMRRVTYLLAYTGEAEALARIMKDKKEYTLHRGKVGDQHGKKSAVGGSVYDRVSFALDKIKNKIMDQIKLGLILEEPQKEIMDRVSKTFPKIKRYGAPKKLLRAAPIKEAKREPSQAESFAFGSIDQEAWEEMVDEYNSQYHPEIRDPELYFDIEGDKYEPLGLDEGEWMGWEVENQLTADFVQQVRDGQVDAANDQGISDFVWITIMGKTTCDSCVWRNGLTSAEIEAKLDGDQSGDDIDATVPPAHASCRCQVAPMVEDLESTSGPKELGDFSTWLKQ